MVLRHLSSTGGGGGGSVNSVTGLNTDNTDPTNPVIQISVDGTTITGDGTSGNPLVATGGGGIPTGTDFSIPFYDATGTYVAGSPSLLFQPNGVSNQQLVLFDGSTPVFQASSNNTANQTYSLGAGSIVVPSHVGNGTIFEINDSLQTAGLYGLTGGFYGNSLILADFANDKVTIGPMNGGNATRYTLDDANLSQTLTTTVASGQTAIIQAQTNLLNFGIPGVSITSTVDGSTLDGLLAGDFTNAGLSTQTTIIGHLNLGGGQQANAVYSNDGTNGTIENSIHDASGNQMKTTLQFSDGLVVNGWDSNTGTQTFGVTNSNSDYGFQVFDNLNLIVSGYPSTRDDSSSSFPVSFLYTDTSGALLSALLSEVIPVPTTPTLTQVLTEGNTNSSIPIVGSNLLQVVGGIQTVLSTTSNQGIIQVDGNQNVQLIGSTSSGATLTGSQFRFDNNGNSEIGDISKAYGLFDNTNNQTTFIGFTQSLGSITHTGSGLNDISVIQSGVYDISGTTTFTLTLTVVFEQLDFTTSSGTFAIGDTVTGSVSGANATIDNIAFGTIMTVLHSADGNPLFQVGETLTATPSGAVGQYTNFNNKGNEFDWVDNQGGSGSGVSVTTSPTLLAHGVSVSFGDNYDHTLGDTWSFSVMPVQFSWAQYDGTTNYTLLQNENGVLKLGDYTGAANGGVVLLDNTGATPSFDFGKLGIGDSIQAFAGTNPIVTIGAADGQGNGNIVKVDDDANQIQIINTTGSILIGDPNAVSGGWVLNFDNSSPTSGGLSAGMSAKGAVFGTSFQSNNPIIEWGDLDLIGNETSYILDDSTSSMSTTARIVSQGDLNTQGNATKIVLDDTLLTIDYSGFYNSVVGASLFHIDWNFGEVDLGDFTGIGNSTYIQISDINSNISIYANAKNYFFLDGGNNTVDFGVFDDVTTLNFNGSIVETGIDIQTYGITVDYFGGFGGKSTLAFTTSTGATTVLLPSPTSTPIGSRVTICDLDAIALTSNITIDSGASSTIAGSTIAQTYVMNLNGQSVTLQKITQFKWKII